MEGEFGLKIEDFGDEDDVDITAYMSGVAETVSRKSRWEVRPDAMVLGFFSFSKFLMYRDLDPENWPADGSLDLHALIRGLLQDGFEAPEPIVSDDGNIDAVIQPVAMNHVVDADFIAIRRDRRSCARTTPCHQGATRYRQVANHHEYHRIGGRSGPNGACSSPRRWLRLTSFTGGSEMSDWARLLWSFIRARPTSEFFSRS